MTPHDEIVRLLALSAAGILPAGEERRVREHLRECERCALRSAEFTALAGALGSMPAVAPSPELVARTQVRVAAELADSADRRQAALLASATAVISWGMAVSTWYVYRILAGDGILGWIVPAVLPAMAAAPAAAALLARRRSLGRSPV